jgi:hypothetical protein
MTRQVAQPRRRDAQRTTPAFPARHGSRTDSPPDELAAFLPPVLDFPQTRAGQPPAAVERQALRVLQRTVGNSAVGGRLRTRIGAAIQRDPPPATDPSLESPKPADLSDSAKELLMKYAEKYLGKLGDEAKKRLADAWDESPGGVIAAGAVIGGAGIAYLVGTKSALPGLPEIPLDVLGGPFKGATMKLEVKGPVTSPESFGFKITFHEQGDKKRKRTTTTAPPNIYTYANPEAIAQQVDGPEFETEVPEGGPDTNLRGANLANLVRIIGNGMREGARAKETRPYVDLGELPPTPPGFVDGLKRIVDALVAAAPSVLGKIEQVNFRVYRSGQVRFIPIRPSPPHTAEESGAAAE